MSDSLESLLDALDAPDEQLAQRLRQDAAARTTYIEHQVIDTLLLEEFGGASMPLITSAPTTSRWQIARPLLASAAMLLLGISLSMLLLPTDTSRLPKIGALTASIDTRWADGAAPIDNHILPHQPLRLERGLASITLRNGVELILEGPCRLTALSEKEITLQRGRISAHVPAGAKGFAIQTTKARIVDLGTSFGVNIDSWGSTHLDVFDGHVEAHLTPSGQAAKRVLLLNAGQAISIDAHAVETRTANQVDYCHKLDPKTAARTIDLLDIVAEGDGLSENHGRGIEPHTGERTSAWWQDHATIGDGAYIPVTWHPMIDGVFVPIQKQGPVQLDSAGHRFDQFPDTNAYFVSPIWSLRPHLAPDQTADEPMKNWVKDARESRKVNPRGRGMLAVHSNAGITFDLAAIRKANPGWRVAHFHATVANVHGLIGSPTRPRQSGDAWVFVDGQVQFVKRDFTRFDDPVEVHIALDPTARFLTLVATDAGNAHNNDQIVYGDARLELNLAPAQTLGESLR